MVSSGRKAYDLYQPWDASGVKPDSDVHAWPQPRVEQVKRALKERPRTFDVRATLARLHKLKAEPVAEHSDGKGKRRWIG
mgnify:CR=1 FL=1